MPAQAVAGKVRFPSGDADRGLGEPKAGYQILYALTKTIKRFIWHGNIGWDFVRRSDDGLILSTALDYELVKNIHAVLEWDGQTDFHANTDGDGSGLLVGFLWNAAEWVTVDVGFRTGLSHEEDRFKLTSGLTFYF